MPIRALPLLLAFAASSVALPAHAQTEFAVFVGINDYIEFDDELGGDLLDAERDARDVPSSAGDLDETLAPDVLGRVAERLDYEELGQSPQITGEGATALFGPPPETDSPCGDQSCSPPNPKEMPKRNVVRFASLRFG